MSYETFNAGAAPATPATSKGTVYLDSADKRLKMLDDAGVKTIVSAVPKASLVFNPEFAIAQRQVLTTLTTYSNTTGRSYGPDRWGMTNENASIQFQAVDSNAAVESGLNARFYGRFKKITNAGKMIVSQVIEGSPAAPTRGRAVRVQFKARYTVAASMTIRCALLSLTSAGTIDTIPATFVSAFGAASTDPTWGTNLTALVPRIVTGTGGSIVGAGITCVLAATWQQYVAIFDVPTTSKNLALVIFTNGLPAANDEMNLTEVSLTDGEEFQDYLPVPHAHELLRCQRFYAKTFPILTAPATGAGVTTGCLRNQLGKAGATALAAQFQWRYPVVMRATPTTVTLFSPASANATVRQISGTAGDLTASTSANTTDASVDVTATGLGTGAVGDQCGIHLTAEAEL